jgi:hypothetical protein
MGRPEIGPWQHKAARQQTPLMALAFLAGTSSATWLCKSYDAGGTLPRFGLFVAMATSAIGTSSLTSGYKLDVNGDHSRHWQH